MYEKHIVTDKLVPFWFHRDKITKDFQDISNWHKNIEILYFIEGNGEVMCDMQTYSVTVGDIFIINSNDIHTVRADNLVRYYCLIIDNKFCEDNGINCDELRFCHKIQDDGIRYLYNNIVETFKTRTEYYKSKLRVSVLNMLISIAENYINDISDEFHERQTESIRNVLEYINENFSDDISVNDLAKYVGYSNAYLSRQFKKATSMSIVEYINYVRCVNASSKLSDGTKNVGEVALECGFKNFSYFSKTFKNVMGTLPSKITK